MTDTTPSNDTPATDGTETPRDSVSVLRRRWRKFRTLKRGWYSFLLLLIVYLVSFFNPLIFNYRALVVCYEGEYYFPAFGNHYQAMDFKQRQIGEANYRKLAVEFEQADGDNWVLMPPYPYGPTENLLLEIEGHPPHPPSALHWLGTDDRGRDILVRLAYGFQISMTFAFTVVILSYIMGMTVGGCLGFFGGRIDMYGQRFIEIWAGIPFLYTIMIIGSTVPRTATILACILAALSWVGISFYMRGEFYREKAKDYVAAAVAQGDSRLRIMFSHILPNSLTPIISFAPFAMVGTIMALVSLDFLGFGLPAPTPSWGELMKQGLDKITSRHWHLIVSPFAAMFSTLLMVVFVGEAIREAFDPKVFSRLR